MQQLSMQQLFNARFKAVTCNTAVFNAASWNAKTFNATTLNASCFIAVAFNSATQQEQLQMQLRRIAQLTMQQLSMS